MLDPATWQKEPIQQMIALLSGELQAREEERLKVEAAKAATAAEKAAAAERYQKMLDEISASLNAVEEATTKSAGSEKVLGYDEEGQLE
jgi:hypothetical protein